MTKIDWDAEGVESWDLREESHGHFAIVKKVQWPVAENGEVFAVDGWEARPIEARHEHEVGPVGYFPLFEAREDAEEYAVTHWLNREE